jgi:hypothetical protein
LRRFRQPIIGLSLAGAAAPLINAGTGPEQSPASEPQLTEADKARMAAAGATPASGDVEDQLAAKIATQHHASKEGSFVQDAVEKYDINEDLARDIYQIAQEEGIDPEVAYGLVKTESSFKNTAVSHVGARGLTQVMPKTASWMVPGTKASDLHDQKTNLRLGFRYLNQMIDKYKGDVRLAHDTHKEHGNLTLAQAIGVSSNIAMAKFSQRLAPVEQYETLRDFGFGSPTGVEFPSESRGRLARPDRWQPMYTRASLAMGYEFGVTSVQLAAAYGAIANNGVLLQPTLLREVRRPDGVLIYRREPEPVRRAVSPEIAARLREFLGRAVDTGGTGERGQLASFPLLGKTGTARRFVEGRYVDEYTASFAALFPADDPQLVVIVKIENPKGQYYGGLTAAPLTKTMLQQALASHRVAINRSALATAESAAAPEPPNSAEPPPVAVRQPAVVVPWPAPAPATPPRTVPVPDVHGTSVREAALALHRLGFRVALRGSGTVLRTSPAAGLPAVHGSTVMVWAGS